MTLPQYPFREQPGLLNAVLEERSQTPKDDAIAASVLEAVSSLVASGLAVYQRPEGGTAPLASYGVLLASSGAGKSFHYGPLTEPVTRWCAAQAAQLPVNQHQQKAEHCVWRKKVLQLGKVIQECVANGDETGPIQAQLAEMLAQEPRPAVSQALLHDDASMQAVLRSLELWPVAGWVVDEGAVALNMLRSKDLSTLANLSGGKVIQHSRVGESRKEIQGCLTTLFMVQPGLFKVFDKKRSEDLKASGLSARFLYHLVSEDWIGTEKAGDAIIGSAYGQYGERVTVMLDEIQARIHVGKKELPAVRLAEKAKVRLAEFQRQNLSLMSRPKLAYCRDFLAKLTGHIARMAAKNHVFLGREGEVSVELVEKAEQVCQYHFEAYQWVHSPLINEPQHVRDAATLVQCLYDQRARDFAYRDLGKVALVMGMSTIRLRRAIADLSNQGRMRMLLRDGEYHIEVLPPVGQMDNILSHCVR